MTPPSDVEARAADSIRRVLRRRLERNGFSVDFPDDLFRVEVGETRRYDGGVEVRLRTWRHWSQAYAHFDTDTEELTYLSIENGCDPPTERELTLERALEIAVRLIEIPHDAELFEFSHEFVAPRRKVTRIEWRHMHRGLRVDGDVLWIQVHPELETLVAMRRLWREVKLPVAGRFISILPFK